MRRLARFAAGVVPGLALLLVAAGPARGQHISREPTDPEKPPPQLLVLPYAFYTETYSLAFGVAATTVGYGQDQLVTFTTAIASINGSYSLFSIGRDLEMPFVPRLFLDWSIYVERLEKLRAYVDGNPCCPDERAGSNESDEDDYLEKRGWDVRVEPTFSLLLPIGSGRDTIINTYVTEGGLLRSGATGGEVWNPLVSGRSTVQLTPFYRHQRYDSGSRSLNTNGLELFLEYDNTDFTPNPSLGSVQRLGVRRDFGLFDSSGAWTGIEGEYTKYFDLGPTRWFRQQVIAFNFWTVATLSGTSPYYANATLGGFDRLRAYSSYRFNDKAAILYTVEYRVIPDWNPLRDVGVLRPLLNWLGTDWWQIVLFGELGRVAPSWDVADLHEDMQWDFGVGLRLRMKKVVVRVDAAVGQEGGRFIGGMAVIAGHPF